MKKKLTGKISGMMDLPLDIAFDLPRIVIIGDLGVEIFNHRGLILYSKERVAVAVEFGTVTVKGSDLEIEEVGPEEMSIRGTVTSVEMSRA